MDNAKKLELLTDIFEMEEGELTPETELATLDNWNSMIKLSLIVMVDDECGKKLPSDIIKSFKNIQDIMNFMQEKGE